MKLFKKMTDENGNLLSDPQLNQIVHLHYESVLDKNPRIYEATIEDIQSNTYENPLTGKTEIVNKLVLHVQQEKEY